MSKSSEILFEKTDSGISILFENSTDSKNNNPGLLRRNILSWYLNSIEINQPIDIFKFDLLANHLVKNHQPFIDEFSGEHETIASRKNKKRTYITSRINELIYLGLIVVHDIQPSSRNKILETKNYRFTEQAKIVAQFMDAYYSEAKKSKIEIFVNSLCNILEKTPSSLVNCIVECLHNFVNEGHCQGLDNKYLDLFLPIFPLENNPFKSIRCTLMNAIIANKQTVSIFLTILEQMEKLSKEMILLQIKLDIEAAYFDGPGVPIDWEIKRLAKIEDPYWITVLNYCLDCKNISSYYMPTYDIFKSIEDYEPDNHLDIFYMSARRSGCNICSTENARFFSPIWYNPVNLSIPNLVDWNYFESIFKQLEEINEKMILEMEEEDKKQIETKTISVESKNSEV